MTLKCSENKEKSLNTESTNAMPIFFKLLQHDTSKKSTFSIKDHVVNNFNYSVKAFH